jgi:hypothetical protein
LLWKSFLLLTWAKKGGDNLAFYHEAGFTEFWLVRLDSSVEIWRSAEPKMNSVCKPGELFSSPLFPGLAIDPAWIVDYPDEINLIRKFSAQIRVLRDPDEPQLTKRARKIAARIAEHFGEAHPSHGELKRQPGRRPPLSPQARTRQQEPGREHER